MELKIAISQIRSYRNDTEKNIRKHIKFIELASKHNSDLILFPEMSLTGYETENANGLIFEMNDIRLNEFKLLSEKYNQIIIVGAPIRIESKMYIGSFIILPNKDIEVYVKKYLHEGEELYFESRKDFDFQIKLKGNKISCAICYDIEVDNHIRNAISNKSTLYLPSIFYSENGIDSGLKRLSFVSKTFSMPVMMSNYVGDSFGIKSGGRSSAWNENGELIISSNDKDECLLIITKKNEMWKGESVFAD